MIRINYKVLDSDETVFKALVTMEGIVEPQIIKISHQMTLVNSKMMDVFRREVKIRFKLKSDDFDLQEEEASLTFQVINWDQYFNAIIRERSYNVVEQYVSTTSYVSSPLIEPNGEPQDAVYERDFVVIEELEDPSANCRKQLIDQLKSKGIDFKLIDGSFQDAIEQISFEALERFVDLDTCVVVYMNEHRGFKHYMLAPVTRDDLVIKLLSYSHGALVVYRPVMFTLFKVKA